MRDFSDAKYANWTEAEIEAEIENEEKGVMGEYEVQDGIRILLDEQWDEMVADNFSEEFSSLENVSTFEESGILTTNKGLVIRLADGSEYQLTIVKSKNAR